MDPSEDTPDPFACPHIRTGTDLVLMAMRGGCTDLETAILQAADWIGRNVPALYSAENAARILRRVCHLG